MFSDFKDYDPLLDDNVSEHINYMVQDAVEKVEKQHKNIINKAKKDKQSVIIAAIRTYPTFVDDKEERKLNDIRQEGFYKGAIWAIKWIESGCKKLGKGQIVKEDITDEEKGIKMYTRISRTFDDDLFGNKKI